MCGSGARVFLFDFFCFFPIQCIFVSRGFGPRGRARARESRGGNSAAVAEIAVSLVTAAIVNVCSNGAASGRQ